MSARKIALVGAVTAAAVGLMPGDAWAAGSAPSGAIFTTVADGSEVNFNQYPSKEDVYLDGGPGPGAPQTAAGLDDGTYVFQVTDPSGKTLLSTDPVSCRQFVVTDGIITSVAPSGGCAHVTGLDVDHGALTVQLMPYDDTPNPGGVYKVWATLVTNYACYPNLAQVDCTVRGSKHGFVPAASKTDNFKVHSTVPQEIDTRFFDSAGNVLDGMGITWTDPLGASNQKWSYWAPQLQIYHEAHVEAVESGTHYIQIDNQPGCTVGDVSVAGSHVGFGPRTVAVKVSGTQKTFTIFVDVDCT
ncbi:MAG TPA: hypothetical protein VE442_11050 [Jatrophihabitans sp.]|nr:hypothetical protein [Jatrophihabitans sp.]